MDENVWRWRDASGMTALIAIAILLLSRLVYLYLADPLHFPVNTVKIVACYKHITREQIAKILSDYTKDSFVFFPTDDLKEKVMALTWAKKVTIKRVWPGTLTLVVEEKEPIARWNKQLITAKGDIFIENNNSSDEAIDQELPSLIGPVDKKQEVLEKYQQLSLLLLNYGLQLKKLSLNTDQTWDISLSNGLKIYLGRGDLKMRLLKLCRAYQAVFAEKNVASVTVDLRYPHGMAVKWFDQK